MGWLAAPAAVVARVVLQRGTAIVYLLAFLASGRQLPALVGEHGLLPVPRLLASGRRLGPSVFRVLRYSDGDS